MEIKIGMVVKRKLDGKEMIVTHYPYKMSDGQELSDRADCKWYDDSGNMKHGIYKLFEINY